MFCTTLRRRPSFAAVLDELASPSGLALKGQQDLDLSLKCKRLISLIENQLDTHDLSLTLSTKTHPQTKIVLPDRRLRVILLSASCAASNQTLEHTLERIHTLGTTNESHVQVIVFLLNPPPDTSFRPANQHHEITSATQTTSTTPKTGMYAYIALQTRLFSAKHIRRGLGMIPLNGVENLPNLLNTYIQNYKTQHASPPPPKPTMQKAVSLLRLCTAASTPMSEQTAYILLDVFGDLRSLMEACKRAEDVEHRDPGILPIALSSSSEMDGEVDLFRRLHGLVDEQECRDLVDFWREEWAVE